MRTKPRREKREPLFKSLMQSATWEKNLPSTYTKIGRAHV